MTETTEPQGIPMNRIPYFQSGDMVDGNYCIRENGGETWLIVKLPGVPRLMHYRLIPEGSNPDGLVRAREWNRDAECVSILDGEIVLEPHGGTPFSFRGTITDGYIQVAE